MSRRTIPVVLGVLVSGVFFSTLSARTWELNPYVGVFAPTEVNSFDLKNPATFGIRGGVFLTPDLQLEGGMGYANHFESTHTDPKSRGFLWEANGLYHFHAGRLRPFALFGVGALNAQVDKATVPQAPDPNSVPFFRDGETFFNVSWGGGIKAQRLWGPMGIRADLRGRTIANVRDDTVTAAEVTAGLIFDWGE
ncbi:MAG TPA: outer membrane beta-barrel protein [Acidobacteriota bacterium]|nr:outer membrane beta-barrel protein [Acidobacteriota bacterium]